MRIGIRAGAVTWSMLTLAVTHLSAQQVSVPDTETVEADYLVQVGSRVRVDRKRGSLTGRLLQLDGRRLLLQVDEDTVPIEIGRSEIRSLEISRGVRRRTRTGAIVGGITLGIPGALLGAAAGSLYRCNFDCADAYRGGLAGGAFFGGIGVGLGALIGSQVKHEEWESATAPRFSASLMPMRGGFGGSLSVRF